MTVSTPVTTIRTPSLASVNASPASTIEVDKGKEKEKEDEEEGQIIETSEEKEDFDALMTPTRDSDGSRMGFKLGEVET
jgi:hypothetical protein